MHNRMLVLISAVLVSAIAYAAFYKWVDEDGVTRYSDTAPPEGGTEVGIPPGPAQAQVRESRERVERIKRGLQEREAARAPGITLRDWSDAPGKAELVSLAKQCRDAKKLLRLFQVARPVFKFNARCERVFVSDSDRAEMVSLAEQQVKNTCNRRIDPQRLGDILLVQGKIREFNERYRQMPGQPNGYPDFAELKSSPALCRCADVFLAEMADPRYRTPRAEIDKARDLIDGLCR